MNSLSNLNGPFEWNSPYQGPNLGSNNCSVWLKTVQFQNRPLYRYALREFGYLGLSPYLWLNSIYHQEEETDRRLVMVKQVIQIAQFSNSPFGSKLIFEPHLSIWISKSRIEVLKMKILICHPLYLRVCTDNNCHSVWIPSRVIMINRAHAVKIIKFLKYVKNFKIE